MALTDIKIRRPEASDAAGIAVIDAEGLATGHATFRDTSHDWHSFSASFMTGCGRALVAEDGGAVAAWAGISPTSTRTVYKGVGEVSIYVSAARQGHGLGRRLLGDLVLASESAGYWTLVAQIFPENEASLSLHTALEFRIVGQEGIWARCPTAHLKIVGVMSSCSKDEARSSGERAEAIVSATRSIC